MVQLTEELSLDKADKTSTNGAAGTSSKVEKAPEPAASAENGDVAMVSVCWFDEVASHGYTAQSCFCDDGDITMWPCLFLGSLWG